jgi:catechol 2,3-dioxygenase-like lactoylglutathione lyase family enzyme
MKLGHFSLSLAVKDMQASRAFYEKLGFIRYDGDGEGWLILKREEVTIGLFHGMFDKNMLTFNPKDLAPLLQDVKQAGLTPLVEKDSPEEGTFFTLEDPDGNPILFDQHPADYVPSAE